MILDDYVSEDEQLGFARRGPSKRRIRPRQFFKRPRTLLRTAKGHKAVAIRRSLTPKPVTQKPAGSSRRRFFAWLRMTSPALYNTIKSRRPDLINDTQSLSGYDGMLGESWTDTIKEIIGAAVPLYQQKKIFEMQVERAAKNLPPLDTSHLQPPGIPIQVELPKEVQKEVTGGLANIKMAIPLLGAGLLLVFLMGRKR